MTLRFQRVLIIFLSIFFLICAVALMLNNFNSNIVFFFTPSELIELENKINEKIRIGGYVKEKSVKRNHNNLNKLTFIVTDNKNDIIIDYEGILPDMFREKQGVVIEGMLIKTNQISATKVFAKHDENYMPASIKKQLKKAEYWKKNY